MSMLRLFDPDGLAAGPTTIRMPAFRRVPSRTTFVNRVAVLDRARVRFENRACPCCRKVTVAPVELSDAEYDRHGREIPGTATIVGFNCERCGHSWPASRPQAM
jgi:hypothetical protein